ncbi:hypothetical protein BHM03_00045864, partial [Ensete ventricosum]
KIRGLAVRLPEIAGICGSPKLASKSDPKSNRIRKIRVRAVHPPAWAGQSPKLPRFLGTDGLAAQLGRLNR